MTRLRLLSAARVLVAATAEAAVTRIEITRRGPLAGGQAFGVDQARAAAW